MCPFEEFIPTYSKVCLRVMFKNMFPEKVSTCIGSSSKEKGILLTLLVGT